MSSEVECMCLECGVSLYHDMGAIVMGDFTLGGMRLVENTPCSVCGGPLAVVGKAGEQPFYKTMEGGESR